jgi:hypothetical protein
MRGAFATVAFVALAMMGMCTQSSALTEHNDEFVQHDFNSSLRVQIDGDSARQGFLTSALRFMADVHPPHEYLRALNPCIALNPLQIPLNPPSNPTKLGRATFEH